MANELTEKTESFVTLVEEQGLGPLIKPFIKEIHLFDSFVAGTTHLKDKTVLDLLDAGMDLTLQREDNPYDENAVLVLYDGRKVGYIPKRDNIVFARLMDAGKLLKAKITNIQDQSGNWKEIDIAIYLIDI